MENRTDDWVCVVWNFLSERLISYRLSLVSYSLILHFALMSNDLKLPYTACFTAMKHHNLLVGGCNWNWTRKLVVSFARFGHSACCSIWRSKLFARSQHCFGNARATHVHKVCHARSDVFRPTSLHRHIIYLYFFNQSLSPGVVCMLADWLVANIIFDLQSSLHDKGKWFFWERTAAATITAPLLSRDTVRCVRS